MRRILVLALALATMGCTKSQLVDFTMVSARRVAKVERTVGPYRLLAGDMHCHVLPPDAPYHVSRELPETRRLAEEEGLDFVVLTPHVPSRFFLDPEQRQWVRSSQQALRAQIAQLGDGGPLFLPGMEYTDYRYGHVGLSFGDIDAVLDEVPPEQRPEVFFERWQARGGLTTINHPFLEPLPRVPIAELHYDLSWRGFPPAGGVVTEPLPPEIVWLTNHATAIETWNETAGHVRDRWLLNDPAWELRQATHLVERLARAEDRRITPVGGSDSHGAWLRPTTWVLATERSPAAIRAGIAAGRTCVRGPDACTLEVRGDQAFQPVGSSVTSASHTIEARASGEATYFLNGAIAATGEGARIAVPGTCSTLHAVVNESVSAPIYVDCPSITGPPFSRAR